MNLFVKLRPHAYTNSPHNNTIGTNNSISFILFTCKCISWHWILLLKEYIHIYKLWIHYLFWWTKLDRNLRWASFMGFGFVRQIYCKILHVRQIEVELPYISHNLVLYNLTNLPTCISILCYTIKIGNVNILIREWITKESRDKMSILMRLFLFESCCLNKIGDLEVERTKNMWWHLG